MSEIRKPSSTGSCLIIAFSILLALLLLMVICDLSILSNLSSQSSTSTPIKPFIIDSTTTENTDLLVITPVIPAVQAFQLPSPLPSPSPPRQDEYEMEMASSDLVTPDPGIPPPAFDEEEERKSIMDYSTVQPSTMSPPAVEEERETSMDSSTQHHFQLPITMPSTESPPTVEDEGEMSMGSSTEQLLQLPTAKLPSIESPPAGQEEQEQEHEKEPEQEREQEPEQEREQEPEQEREQEQEQERDQEQEHERDQQQEQDQEPEQKQEQEEQEGEPSMDSPSNSIQLTQKEYNIQPPEPLLSLQSPEGGTQTTDDSTTSSLTDTPHEQKTEQQDEPRIANIIPDHPTTEPQFDPPPLSSDFHRRIQEFIHDKSCKTHFFMNRLPPAPLFIKRDMMAVDSLFKTNPQGCLVLFSDIMDTRKGKKILKPITDLGFRILVIPPDFPSLLSDTPALHWYEELQKGHIDPGEIHISHNLSDLMRLLCLYKYGGVYLDTDFVILKDFSTLRNTVGAQDINPDTGEWIQINGAAMIFDKGHPLVLEFIKEFVTNFNGNLWGFQGPELVTRVIEKVVEENGGLVIDGHGFTVLPEIAFYPISWTRASDLFTRPNDTEQVRMTRELTAHFKANSYGVHFWNQLSQQLKIMKGSIIRRLYTDHCVVCRYA